MTKKLLVPLTMFVVFVMCAGQSANAATYNLNVGNSGISPPYAGPYGEIKITIVNGDEATVELTAASNVGGYSYSFGGTGMIYLNLSGSGFGYSSFTGTVKPGGTPGSPSLDLDQNQDGWGSFNFSLKNSDGFEDSYTHLTFTLTKTGGADWTDANILTPNGPNGTGYSLGGHVYVRNASNDSNAGATGFAANGGGAVPEINPASTSSAFTFLFGAVMVLGAKLRRKVVTRQ